MRLPSRDTESNPPPPPPFQGGEEEGRGRPYTTCPAAQPLAQAHWKL
jgi:hypothetical protein